MTRFNLREPWHLLPEVPRPTADSVALAGVGAGLQNPAPPDDINIIHLRNSLILVLIIFLHQNVAVDIVVLGFRQSKLSKNFYSQKINSNCIPVFFLTLHQLLSKCGWLFCSRTTNYFHMLKLKCFIFSWLYLSSSFFRDSVCFLFGSNPTAQTFQI